MPTVLSAETPPHSLDAIAKAIATCRRCPIGCNGTHAVMGEGRAHSALMIVGEQPGDTEEREGRPFIGPAGHLLNQHLDTAGIARADLYHQCRKALQVRPAQQAPVAPAVDGGRDRHMPVVA